ncbi:WD repeat-containing protein 76-like [Protopterus annectens]|uniref:WD repeat-containing protein 76-like n=1 Tax=Protopterus annectens TaxID=7888 RepID=UPI001CFA8A0E|nr:WD repeat-containing protein 76-like [Protopterus annectens]XP_043933653.1 WD repeat-containing protein 76-like [Protopterus annectens]
MASKNVQDGSVKKGLTRKCLVKKKATQKESFYERLPKRSRKEFLQKCEAVSSSEEASFTLPLLPHHSNVLSTKARSAMTVENASERDSSDEDNNTFSEDELPHLSKYEKKRLKNIQENAKFFASLKVKETTASLFTGAPRTLSKFRREKKTKPKKNVAMASRRSMRLRGLGVFRQSFRLQRLDPQGIPLSELPEKTAKAYLSGCVTKPAGPLQMVPVNEEQDDAFLNFLEGWENIFSKVKMSTDRKQANSLDRYKASLNCMTIKEGYVTKVVNGRIHSIAIHPSETPILVAAGDGQGTVGIWNLSKKNDPRNENFVLEPHAHRVSCLHFSPSNPSQLLSVSYDGTLRCGDFSKAVFDEIYRMEDFSLTSFDFLGRDGSTLIVSQFDGGFAVVDRRTPGTSHEMSGTVEMGELKNVHVHPEDAHYFVGCGGSSVNIYDARQIKNKELLNPVARLNGHSRIVSSAYFSPMNGKRVLTTCVDDNLRVYDTSCILPDIGLLASISHNNVGEGLTCFKAIWDPKRKDCFVVGSIAHPRQIEVFHETGSLVHSFTNVNYLTSMCFCNTMHPTRNMLAAGSHRGFVYVFMD